MSDYLYIGCDNLVAWTSPKDAVDNTSIGSDAVGSVTVKDADGNEVTGAVDLTATYAAGPPEKYHATVPNTVDLTDGETYYVEFTLTASDGAPHGFKRRRVRAVYSSV